MTHPQSLREHCPLYRGTIYERVTGVRGPGARRLGDSRRPNPTLSRLGAAVPTCNSEITRGLIGVIEAHVVFVGTSIRTESKSVIDNAVSMLAQETVKLSGQDVLPALGSHRIQREHRTR